MIKDTGIFKKAKVLRDINSEIISLEKTVQRLRDTANAISQQIMIDRQQLKDDYLVIFDKEIERELEVVA